MCGENGDFGKCRNAAGWSGKNEEGMGRTPMNRELNHKKTHGLTKETVVWIVSKKVDPRRSRQPFFQGGRHVQRLLIAQNRKRWKVDSGSDGGSTAGGKVKGGLPPSARNDGFLGTKIILQQLAQTW